MAGTIPSAALLMAERAERIMRRGHTANIVQAQQAQNDLTQQIIPMSSTRLSREEVCNTAVAQAEAAQQYSVQALYGHAIHRPEWMALNGQQLDSDWPDAFEAQKRAEELAEALLRENLSESQLAEYAKDKSFRVIGSDSGRLYRINYGTSMNIDELDRLANVVCQWCFQPQGAPSVGDTMLTQKIALENYEYQALSVANRFSDPGSTFFDGMYQELVEVFSTLGRGNR